MTPDGMFLGKDGLSLYPDNSGRDLRGELEGANYAGRYAEITADECLSR